MDAYPVDARTLEPGPTGREAPVPPIGDVVVRPVADAGAPSVARRRFLIVVDVGHVSRRGLINVREAARTFLEETVGLADLVGLVYVSPRFGLLYRVPFTVRHAAVTEALGELRSGAAMDRVESPLDGVDIDAIADGLLDEDGALARAIREGSQLRLEAAAETFLEQLVTLVDDLAPLRGRKHVLFFSQGVTDQALGARPGAMPTGGTGVRDTLEQVADSARAAGVVFHALLPESLPPPSRSDIREFEPARRPHGSVDILGDLQSLAYLAGETGGTASWFDHNLAAGAAAVEEVSRRYYVLAMPVRSEDPAEIGLRVRTRVPAATVIGAPERLAVRARVDLRGGIEGDFRAAEALEIGVDTSGMEVDLVTVPLSHPSGVGRLALFASVPGSQVDELLARRGDGGLDLEVLGMATSRRGTVVDHFRGRVRMTGRQQGDAPMGPLRYYNLLVVPPGRYHVKLIMREAAAAAFASRSLELVVPESRSSGLAVEGPVSVVHRVVPGELIEGIRPGSAPAHRRGEPLAYPLQVADLRVAPLRDPALRAGSSHLLFARVRGVGRHPFADGPAVGLEIDLVAETGREHAMPAIEVVRSAMDGDGTLRLLVRLPVGGDVAPGSYELRLRVEDGVTGEWTEAVEEVVVSSG